MRTLWPHAPGESWKRCGTASRSRHDEKLECLLQAREYSEQGHRNVQDWIDTSLAGLTTASAKEIAEEALTQGTLDWLPRAKG